MDLLHTGLSVNKDGYINMMLELQKRKLSAMQFAMREFTPPTYIHKQPRHTSDIWKSALKSDRVQWIIRQIVRSENKTEEQVIKEAKEILIELSYTDHMTLVRMFGFSLYKVMSVIYPDGVFINYEAAEKIRSTLQQHPVVFMPSHRSYMDFLMLSLLCFYLNLPLPAIAAGMDFKSMAVVSTILRASGAFFMRRSFGSDRLYWALFTEYVHTILINGDRPMEFFIEGTRSRVGKSLNPKFGLLSVISEPYLKAQTYDVVIVPVSISYDRLLEEKLYAYELLGVPKPKESTSGVFKAATILQDNYGSVHCHFGEGMSLRQYFGHLDRAVHACYPRYMLNLSAAEQKSMKILAYRVLLKQQENMVCSPFTLIATILCLHTDGISLSELINEMIWLKSILTKCNVKLLWPVGSMNEIVANYLHRYRHIVSSTNMNGQSAVTEDSWISIPVSSARFAKSRSASVIDPKIQDDAASHIMLANYRNQLLCYLIRPALIAFCLHKLCTAREDCSVFHRDQCMQDFKFLCQLLHKEFIFEPDQTEKDFEQGIKILTKCGIVRQTCEDEYNVESHAGRMLVFLQTTFSPFLVSYWLTAQYLLFSGGMHDLTKVDGQIQQWIVGHRNESGVLYEMLSLNVISNAVHALINQGALVLNKTGSKNIIDPLHSNLLHISLQIAQFTKVPQITGNTSVTVVETARSKM